MDEGFLTLGIEEEFQIVDAETRELRAHIDAVLEAATPTLGELVKPEMMQSVVEVGTNICRDISEARIGEHFLVLIETFRPRDPATRSGSRLR